MTRQELLVNIPLLSTLSALGLFVAVHAITVWRNRNRAAVASRGSSGRFAVIQWLSWGLVAAGLLGLAGSLISLEFAARQGLLSGNGLFAVRARDGWTLEFLFDGDSVQAGALLARLHSPEREAELNVLHLREIGLATRKTLLSHQPLAPDPKLVRQLHDTTDERRQLRAYLRQLISEGRLVSRTLLVEGLEKREKLQELQSDGTRLAREVEQARAKKHLSEQNLQRIEGMVAGKLATQVSLDEMRTELEVLQSEVAGLLASSTHNKGEQQLVEGNIARLEALHTKQSQHLQDELELTHAELDDMTEARQGLESRLAEDLERARRLREQELKAVDLDLQQIQTQVRALEAILNITAPFAGEVVYREPSPNAAEAATPLLVLAPRGEFDLRLRLPAAEVSALAAAGAVTIELTEPSVQRRFPGELIRWHALPEDPGFVLAQLRCQPPAEAIRELATGAKVAARLVWRPPLSTISTFPLAMTALLVGALGIGLGWARVGPRWASETTRVAGAEPLLEGGPLEERLTDPPVDTAMAGRAEPAPSALGHSWTANVQYGVFGDLLRTLAQQLRESVVYDQPDASLLAAVEWSLDRHHTRAVDTLRGVLTKKWRPEPASAMNASPGSCAWWPQPWSKRRRSAPRHRREPTDGPRAHPGGRGNPDAVVHPTCQGCDGSHAWSRSLWP
jgi:hypothetical protein